MAHQFVGTGVALPVPFTLRRGMPLAALRQRFLRGDERTRRQTRDSGDFLQSHQRLQCASRLGARVRLVSDRVAKRLRAEVNRSPKPVVVVRKSFVGGQVARDAQVRTGDQAVPYVTLFDALVEIFRLFLQLHRTPLDERDAFFGAHPNPAALVALIHPNVEDLVTGQPASAIKILPAVPAKFGVRIKARGALVTAEPDRAGFFARENFQALDRSAFGVLPGQTARLGADFGGHCGSLDRKVADRFLGLREAGAGRQHQTDCPKQQTHGAHHQGRG